VSSPVRGTAFAEWIGDRQITSLGTNDGATPIAFQKWHKFKESFAPELVAQAIQDSPMPVHSCYDPFGGSGTTALTCQMLGVDSATTEVNPFLVDVIRAKLAAYDIDAITRTLASVRRMARRTPVDPYDRFSALPQTFLPPGRNGRWLFDEGAAASLASILAAIDRVARAEEARLFRIVLAGILAEVSNITINGKGRRYRRGVHFGTRTGEEVHQLFADRAGRALRDIIKFSDRPRPLADVNQGDARLVIPPRPIDLSVFSPPYPNSFDYTDVYNLELWMLGYLTDPSENQSLRRATLSSHVQVSREFASAPQGSDRLLEIVAGLEKVASDLWSPWLPRMIGAYFADLLDVLQRIRPNLAEGGQVWIVVGDSRYARTTIPVAGILQDLAAHHQWTVLRAEPIRHMRSSAQQGGTAELPESLLILQT
jgi:hypothetical protein